MKKFAYLRLCIAVAAAGSILVANVLAASEHLGQVRFGDVPVPGASVEAIQGDKKVWVFTNAEGRYVMLDLQDGTWTIQVTMRGFETLRRDVVVSSETATAQWDLKMRSLDDFEAGDKEELPAGFPESSGLSTPALRLPSANSEPAETSDRLLINGSVVNGAATRFALRQAFGNVRPVGRSPYQGNVFVNGTNALFDARPYSLTGQNTPRADYSRLQGSFTIGGPLRIPRLFRLGQFTLTYNRTQNKNADVETAQMPTVAERAGNFSASAVQPIDPLTGSFFPGGIIPEDRINPAASSLVVLYREPNFIGAGRYNYQIPVVGVTHGDSFQANVTGIRIGRRDQLSGSGSFQSTRSDNPDLFGFTDARRSSSANGALNWVHRMTPKVSGTVRYTFSRGVSKALPYFGGRQDISGEAGISGNDRDPRNWGPPALSFSGGIARLSTGSYALNRSQTHSISYASSWIRGPHTFTYGADFKKQQDNLLSQQNARGAFTFTGAATGNDFADFLLGIPAASTLAFGNADKYFRQSFASAYVNDDLRFLSGVTISLGVRWEYESPVTEKYGRLVNLDIGPGFATATPVVAATRENSLLIPDRSGFQPRIGLAWRPRVESSVVVRAGYGVYRDTSVYRTIADQMSQQAPLSKSLSVQNTVDHPFTLADGFRGSPAVTPTTFAVNPKFQPGNAQNWSLAIQRDLPFAMQVVVTYLVIKGTHVPQRILPNTFPAGVVNPCGTCPVGFTYLTSSGNTNRHSGSIELRRRQRNGFEITGRYTFAKAIDDAGLGVGNHVAQNWLNLRAERGLSSFDQRHQLTLQGQYTTGMLAGIGSFEGGWYGVLLRGWTLSSQLTIGSGAPSTPTLFAPVNGTGVTGSLRPNVTGVPLLIPGSKVLNPAAFSSPGPGEWGNAARNSITGPGQFQMDATLSRAFRLNERVSMDLRVDSTNVLNHVSFTGFNTIVNNSQFGQPIRANSMRILRPSLRVRF